MPDGTMNLAAEVEAAVTGTEVDRQTTSSRRAGREDASQHTMARIEMKTMVDIVVLTSTKTSRREQREESNRM